MVERKGHAPIKVRSVFISDIHLGFKGCSAELLLDYLHHAGIVFYREGLFDDRIVLDQAWALEAVYAVFHREKCYRQLHQLRGQGLRTTFSGPTHHFFLRF